jgi:hypothetical protein
LEKEDITFSELYSLTNKKIIIYGTNYRLGRSEIFSFENTPDMSILLAIRISISVPVIFTPVIYNDNYYVDGALTNNFPIGNSDPDTTLGLYIKNTTVNKMNNLQTFIMGCLSIITDTISEKDIEKYPYIIKIGNCNQELTNFNLSLEKKKLIISLGTKAVEEFLTKPEIICRNLLNDLINDICNN